MIYQQITEKHWHQYNEDNPEDVSDERNLDVLHVSL